jgi:hypothetical protein
VQSLRGLNPSVVAEKDGTLKIIPELDPFSPANGFNPNGASHYPKEFQARYFAAQSKAMNERIALAQERMDRIKEEKYPYPDDDIVIIPRSDFPARAGNASLKRWTPVFRS